ncbi:MAG: winged helix-turn-helix domain-containing protein [Burkholderiaceae bacterium]
MIQLGTTVFDPSAQMLRDSAGAKIALRAQTLRVLECLVATNGALVTKEHLVSQVWGSIAVTDDSLVQCIGEIRSAIGDSAHQVLQTEHRRGYRLVCSAPAPLAPANDPALAPALSTVHNADGLITPAIAVMAFTSMDGDARSERLATAFAGDLITELAKYKELRVIGRQSAFALRGQALTSKEICEKLHASYIVSGHMQRNETTVQWSLELVNGQDEEIVWSERNTDSSCAAYGETDALVGQLAGKIGGHFRDDTLRQSMVKTVEELGAYELVKRIGATLFRTTVQSTREALDMAALAVKKYPSYAPAWRVLANTQMWDTNYCHTGQWTGKNLSDSLKAVHKAIELNPLDPIAFCVLANLLAENGQFQEALFAVEHARDLGPSDPAVVNFHAWVLLYCGQLSEARSTAEASIKSMPNGHPTHLALLGRILVAMENCETAIARLSQTLLFSPGNTQARMAIIVALHETGEHALAREHFTQLLATTHGLDEGYFGRRWSATPEVRDRYICALRACGLQPGAT